MSLVVGVAGPSAKATGIVSHVRVVRRSTRAQRPRRWQVASPKRRHCGPFSSRSHDGEVISLGQGTSSGILRMAPSTSRGLRALRPGLEAAQER
jgi:hypothetical protein